MRGPVCVKSVMFVGLVLAHVLHQRQKEVARASVVEFLVSVGAEEKSPVGSDNGLPRWSKGAQKPHGDKNVRG